VNGYPWFEENGLALEAFRHAAAANDVARAERLIGAEGMPLHLRGAVAEIVAWLDALPEVVRNARPSLWVRQATLSLVIGQTGGVEEMLVAAESALKERRPGHDLEGVADPQIRDLLGVMATARSTLALTRYRVEEMIAQAQRALAYLHPANLSFRATAHWILGNAYEQVGDRPATATAFTEAIALSQASGDSFTTILAMIGLGQVQQADNRLHQAADTYRRVLAMTGEQPLQIIYEGHLGLARILYQWNDLEAAERHGTESARLARQYEAVIDRFVVCELFLAHLALARGAVAEAATMIAEAEQIVRRHDFVHRLAEVAAARLPVLLRRGDLEAAGRLADKYELALGRARVALARGDTTIALALLPARRREMEAKGWEDERLKAMVLQAVAHHLHGDEEGALERLAEALALAEPAGFIRLFVDEGLPMAQLLQVALRHNIAPAYVRRLLAAFPTGDPAPSPPPAPHSLIEPLTEREREVLHLIAQGLSNREIGERLFIALSTVKGHNRRIYAKLQVQRRTEAVARARALGML
jgi:LuxR family maltose regulon positive regulatory protein